MTRLEGKTLLYRYVDRDHLNYHPGTLDLSILNNVINSDNGGRMVYIKHVINDYYDKNQ